MEIGELVICLCPISPLQYSMRVAKVRLKVVAAKNDARKQGLHNIHMYPCVSTFQN